MMEELKQLMETMSAAEAGRIFSERHGHLPVRKKSGWNLFLPVPENGRLLEVGAGFGEDTVAVAGRVKQIHALVPDETNEAVLRRHLEERDVDNVEVLVSEEPWALSLGDGSVDTVTMEEAAATGFEIERGHVPSLAREWKRVLAPGGAVLLSVRNPLERKLGIGSLRAKLQVKADQDVLNRVVKRRGRERSGLPGPGALIQIMKQAGFETPQVYAPVPNETQAQMILPLDDDRAIRYFLHHLLRKNSPLMRAAIGGADLLVRLKLFRHIVPAYFMIFRTSEE
ncbi:MAG: methyltransferase domain-containing protein [Verrucomicrobiota bacterium]